MRPRTDSPNRGIGSTGLLTGPAAQLAATILVRLCAKVGKGAGPSDGAGVLISHDGGGTQTPDGVAVSLVSLMAM